MAVELLSDRVDELCRFIRDNSLQPPSMDEEKAVSLMKVLGHLRLSSAVSGKDGLMAPRQRASASSTSAPNILPPSQTTVSQTMLNLYHDSRDGIDLRTSPTSNEGDQPPTIWTDPLSASEMNILLQTGGMNTPSGASPQDQVEALGQAPYPAWELSDFEIPMLNVELADFMGLGGLNPALDNSDDVHPPQTYGVDENCDNTENLIKQLSDRIGSLRIGAGGQVRYYGPTVQFQPG